MQTVPNPNPNGTGSNSSDPGPKVNQSIPGQISVEEALKGGNGAKIDPMSFGTMPGPSGTANSVSVGSLLEGKIAVDIIDALVPGLVVVLFHAFKVTLRKADFQLTAKEKDVLGPIVQKCMDSISLNFDSPWTVLAITLLAFYGAKIAEKGLVAVLDKKMETQKTGSAPDLSKEQIKRPDMKIVKDPPPAPAETPEQTFIRETLRPWTEDDVKLVDAKRKKGPTEARKWLALNWVKKGGII